MVTNRYAAKMHSLCRVVALGTAAATALGVQLFALGGANAQGPSEVSIAYSIDATPFQYRDDQGQPAGVLIDLWRIWSEKTGIAVRFEPADWNDTLTMVRDGDADIHAGLFYNETRDTFLDYASALYESTSHFFFHRSITGLSDVQDLKAFKVGSQTGDFTANYVNETVPEAALVGYPNYTAVVEAARRGEIRVFAGLTTSMLRLLTDAGITDEYRYHSNRPMFKREWRAAVAEGNSELLATVNEGMALISENERLTVAKKWSGQTASTDKSRLIIGIDRNYPPLTMINAVGEPAGLLVDFWRLWAQKSGQKIEFSASSWAESLEALENGEVDIHAGMFASAERDRRFDFSQPLYEISSRLFFAADRKLAGGFAELAGRPVGVIRGSFGEAYLSDNHPSVEGVSLADDVAMVQAALRGEIDAFVSEDLAVAAVVEELGVPGQIVGADDILYSNAFRAAVRDGEADLLAMVNAGFAEITESEKASIEHNWVDIARFDYTLLWRGLGLFGLVLLIVGIWVVQNWRQRAALTAAAGQMRRILEASPVGVTVTDIGTGKLVYTNPRTIEMFGLAGQSLNVIEPSSFYADPADRQGVLDAFTADGSITNREVRMRHTSGREIWDLMSISPIEFEGRDCFLGWHYDISDLKQAEAEVRESERNLQQILDSSPVGLAITSEDVTRRLYVNTKFGALFGADTPEDLLALNMADSYVDRDDFDSLREALTSGQKIFGREIQRRRIDGSPWWCLMDWSSIEYKGEPAHIVWHYDITDVKQASAALDEKTRVLDDVMANVVQAVIKFDRNRELVYWNRRLQEMLDVDDELLFVGQSYEAMSMFLAVRGDYGAGDPAELVRSRMDQLWSGEYGRSELSIGDAIYEVVVQPTADEGIVVTYTDITERKQAEAEMARQKAVLEMVLENMDQGMSMTDSDLNLIAFNNRFMELLEFPADRFSLGDPHEAFLRYNAERGEYGPGDPDRQVEERLALARKFEAHQFERERSDGTVIEIRGKPVAGGGFLTMYTDVTERRRAEQELREREQSLQNVLDSSPVGISILARESGRRVYVNDRFISMFGAESADQLLELNPADSFADPADFKLVQEGMRTNQLIAAEEVQRKRMDGTPWWCLMDQTPIEFQGEDSVIVWHYDITEMKAAEQEIRESQKNLETILERSPLGIAINAADDARRLYINSRFVNMLGAETEADLVGMKVEDTFVDPADLTEMLKRFASDEEVVSMETHKKKLDGTQWWCLTVRTKCHYNGVDALLNWHMDITERKDAEERVRESEQRMVSILRESPVGVAIVKAADSHIAFANPRLCDLLGIEESDLVDSHVGGYYLDPDERRKMLERYEREGFFYDHEIEMKRADGSSFWSAASILPIEHDGAPARLTWYYDITAMKEAEREIRESEQRMVSILRESPIGVAIVRISDSKIMFANSRMCNQLRVEETEFVGSSIGSYYFNPEVRKPMIKKFEEQGFFYDIEAEMLRTDGTTFWSTVSVLPIEYEGEIARLSWYYDITKMKDAEKEVRESERRLMDMLEASPIAVDIVRMSDQRLVYANSREIELFKFDRDKLDETDVTTLYEDNDNWRHLRSQLQQDKTVRDYELRMKRMDGSSFWTLASYSKIDYRGEPARLSWFYDISKQKETEAQLADSIGLVTSSIEYASRIQRSILPEPTLLDRYVTDHFVIWEPRDVVGGDLFWIREERTGCMLILLDCTGHGVPGALMTTIVNGAIEQAFAETADPARLVANVNRRVKAALKQDGEFGDADDGLEMGVCLIEPSRGRLVFAGSGIPLVMVANGESRIVAGERCGCGYRRVPMDQRFTNHSMRIEPDMSFYMFSDGFVDQVGGPKRRAFGKRRLIDGLKRSNNGSMRHQRDDVLAEFADYQGDEVRRDDLSMIGFTGCR